ncbi:hypothetical protein N9189_03005 [Pirellulaceae bacterium]|nr:hypothetical protein [Pirellulaceae bacterium]
MEDVGIAQNEHTQALIREETKHQEVDADILLVSANASAKAIVVTADQFLFPLLTASVLTPEQQVCLDECNTNCVGNRDCWFCFTQAVPAVLA